MTTEERSHDATGWDRFHLEDVSRAPQNRHRSRQADAAKRARRWHHAKWIAINVALIAVTGWIYAEYLIPRFIVGDTAATRVAPDVWIADRSNGEPKAPPGANRRESTSPVAASSRGDLDSSPGRHHPRRDQKPSQSAFARTDLPEPGPGPRANAIDAAMKRGDFRCIGGRGYIIERTSAGTTVKDTEMSCWVRGFNG